MRLSHAGFLVRAVGRPPPYAAPSRSLIRLRLLATLHESFSASNHPTQADSAEIAPI